MRTRRVGAGWAILASSVPMFMVSLNNLVVTNALYEIGQDLAADVEQLQWVVNAYILAFAGLLLTGAALGDRFGRRRVFLWAVGLFSAGSLACALADDTATLIAARVVQGAGAAAVLPLSLTLLAAAVPEHKRSLAIGLWGGINGLGVAVGPLVGGAVTEGMAWQWIFWINLPVGAIAVPLVLWAVREGTGAGHGVGEGLGKGLGKGLDLPGMLLVCTAVTVAVWAIVETHDAGWTSPRILAAFGMAAALLVAFVAWERRVDNPLLPLSFYRIRAFVLSNLASLAMFFGVFGSIFFLAQYLQGPLGFSAFEAGLRTLPWTAMPMLVAPLAGAFTDRIGGGRLITAGLLLQAGGLAWIAGIATTDLAYDRLVPPMVIAGIGMGLVFAPLSAVVLGSVRPDEFGKASGANNTVREVGGALGIAVLVTVFQEYATSSPGPTANPAQAFVDGMVPAVWVGVAVVALGAVVAAFIPRRLRAVTEPASAQPARPVLAEAPVPA